MSNRCSRTQRWLPFAFVFALVACGGGGDANEVGIADANAANNAVATANRSILDNVFTATLDAAQTATSRSSSASGIGIIMVDPANRLMRATLTTAGIEGTSAAITIASARTMGPAVFPLVEIPAGSGIWSAQTILSDEQLATLRNGNYYFEVSSLAFPEGEIRGQIAPRLSESGVATPLDGTSIGDAGFGNGGLATGNSDIGSLGNPAFGGFPDSSTTGTSIGPGGLVTPGSTGFTGDAGLNNSVARRTTYVNVLTGAQQVPPNGSRAVAIGVVIADAVGQTMVASITSLGIAGLGAHIHRGVAGSSGDTVFTLNETSAGSGIWGARIAVSEEELTAFPRGTYYFDIHTAALPDGELRGQIVGSAGFGNTDIGRRIGTSRDGGLDAQPFISGRETLGVRDNVTGNTGASVPTFGNPVGSGIGSGIDTGFTGSVPTLGNPAGSGIGSAAGTGMGGSPIFGSAADSIAGF